MSDQASQDASEVIEHDAAAGVKPERLISLDAFRGFVIAGMLLVNLTWGESAWGTGLGLAAAEQLAHVAWNDPEQGVTLTDMVFPWFLFIVGVSAPLSMLSGRGRERSKMSRLLIALRRAIVIYLLGVLLTHAGTWLGRPMLWRDVLSWNVLQIIAAAYVVTVAVTMLPRWSWWVFVVAVLVGKWVIMLGIDAEWVRGVMQGAGMNPRVAVTEGVEPAIGRGTFVHFDDVKRLLNREHIDASAGALAAWDRYALGWIGMAQQWLPAAAISVMGALAATLLLKDTMPRIARAGLLFSAGLAATALGVVLEGGYQPGGGGWLGSLTVPASKWVFSPAYCLIAAGSGAAVLSVFYAVIDVFGKRWAAEPWRTYGVNAIALYVGAELSYKLAFGRWRLGLPGGTDQSAALPGAINTWVKSWLPDGDLASWGPVFGLESSAGSLSWVMISGMIFAILWLAGWYLLCRWMDRRKIYLKV